VGLAAVTGAGLVAAGAGCGLSVSAESEASSFESFVEASFAAGADVGFAEFGLPAFVLAGAEDDVAEGVAFVAVDVADELGAGVGVEAGGLEADGLGADGLEEAAAESVVG
jgi:hypothetical protein